MNKNDWTDTKYFEYEILEDNTIKVLGFKKNTQIPRNLIIPEVIENKLVTLIGKQAFKGMKLKSVVIPSSVKEIEIEAFSKNELDNLVLNEGLEKIHYGVFSFNKLKELIIPNSVREISNYAFNENTLENIILGEEVKFLKHGCFFANRLKKSCYTK